MIESYQKDLLKGISSWFEILEELSKNTTDTSGLPKLEVSLRSGRMFAGSVIGLKTSIEGNVLMLLEQAEIHSKARAHLIQCEEIAALSFVDPEVYLSIFSKSIISELELNRKSKIIEDEIEKILSTRIAISFHKESIKESDRSQILQLIQELPTIFRKLTKDTIGNSQITENVLDIEIRMGKTAETNLTKKHLICTFAKDSEVYLSKQKEALLHSIEKVL